MVYELDEFGTSTGAEQLEQRQKEAQEQAQKQKEAEALRNKEIEQARAEKEATQKELEALKKQYESVNAEFTKIKSAFGPDDKKGLDPYESLINRGVKPEEIAGYDAMQKAWFEKNLGMSPDEFKETYGNIAYQAQNSSLVAAELSYEKAKTRLFDEIQSTNPEIRVDYFANRLAELEKSMDQNTFNQLKMLPPNQLMETLKTTYYREIGEVKANPEGISRYKKFLAEAGDASKQDKLDSSNVGSYSSNIARKPTADDYGKKEMSLQKAVDLQLFMEE